MEKMTNSWYAPVLIREGAEDAQWTILDDGGVETDKILKTLRNSSGDDGALVYDKLSELSGTFEVISYTESQAVISSKEIKGRRPQRRS